jgi:HK97 family phage portal protein
MRYVGLRALKFAGVRPADPALVALWGGGDTASGVDVNERTALNYSAVFAATRLLAESVASLPRITYRRTANGGKERAENTPQYTLLHDAPNPEMSAFTFHETLQAHVVGWGNAYAEIEREKDKITPRALWPLTPDVVRPSRADDGRLYYEVSDTAGVPRKVLAENMIHVPGLGWDGLKGYPVLSMAREGIALGMVTEKFGASFFGNGAHVGGTLEHPGELSEPAQQNLRESWRRLYGGPNKAGAVAILEEGMKYTPFGVPPENAQFLQTRQFQIVEIARWFNIPPHLLRDLSNATFSNIEHQGLDFLIYTLRPWLIRWEQEYARKLFLAEQRRTLFVEHMVDALLRADTKSRYEAYNLGRNGGWLSLNDILRAENQNPLKEGGDDRLMPVNMAVIGRAAARPVDMAAVASVTDFLRSIKPAPWALAAELYRAALPAASDSLVSGLVAKLQSDNIVTGAAA